MTTHELQQEILRLKKEKNVCILAHAYQSQAVLEVLYRHVETNLGFQTRIHWTPDTLVLWDNWAVQHQAIWDYYPYERWGERISAISGARPQQ